MLPKEKIDHLIHLDNIKDDLNEPDRHLNIFSAFFASMHMCLQFVTLVYETVKPRQTHKKSNKKNKLN